MRTRKKVCVGLFVVVAMVLASRPLVELFQHTQRLPGNNPDDELSVERTKVMLADRLVGLLNLQSGNTVLDLGAGFGMYAFRLARAVGPDGTVFATDVDEEAISHLAERARKEEVANVVPVRVAGRGLDPFYRAHTFDVIFASDVVTEIRNPEAFFDALRPSLREGSGRLWVVTVRLDPDFTLDEFGSPDNLRAALTSDLAQTALVPRLSAASRQALVAGQPAASPDSFVETALEDLNRLLADHSLWPEAQEKRWPLNAQDAKLRAVLSEMLAREGVFGTEADPRGGAAKRVLRLLIRILLLNLMDNTLWSKAVALNKLSKAQLQPLLAPLTFDTFWGRPAFLESVGYEVVQEHKDIHYCCVWEYRRAR